MSGLDRPAKLSAASFKSTDSKSGKNVTKGGGGSHTHPSIFLMFLLVRGKKLTSEFFLQRISNATVGLLMISDK